MALKKYFIIVAFCAVKVNCNQRNYLFSLDEKRFRCNQTENECQKFNNILRERVSMQNKWGF